MIGFVGGKPKKQIVRISGYTLKREKKPFTSALFPGITFRWKLYRGRKIDPECFVGPFPSKYLAMAFIRESVTEDLRGNTKGEKNFLSR